MFDNRLVTVWSAPNYCYRCGNEASILAFDSTDSKDAKLFTAVPDSEIYSYSSENYHPLLHVIIICNYTCLVIQAIIVVIVIVNNCCYYFHCY